MAWLSCRKAGLLLVLVLVISERHRILVWTLQSDQPPALLAPGDEGPDVTWHDDYYTIEVLAPGIFALGEPRYHQQNINYLITGSRRAILFDAGSGYRDIRPLVQALTAKPVTFVPSHFHFDHIGNEVQFERVAVVDLPYLRARAPENKLQLNWREHLGSMEGYKAPVLTISEWLAPGQVIDLGGKKLEVIHTPGHTEDSISLYDASEHLLFSGDFIYQGPLYGFLPTSSLRDYQSGAERILQVAAGNSMVVGAHRAGPPGTPRQ